MLRGFQAESIDHEADHAHVVRLWLSDGPAPDHVEIGDTKFLFSAHFKKSGADLVLTGDEHKMVLVDYFNLAKRPDLSSHGAILSADLVTHLAGPDAPGQFAQAGAPAGAQVIGKCERIGGGATVQHANGVTEELKANDAILRGDVVMTNDGSSAVLSLIDGTVFNMGASARMVLSEVLYDSNSTSNSAVVSLVKGTFSFVAGHVAHTGDMKLDTPVATMGIRGTAGTTTVNADASGNVYEVNFSLMPDPDGHVGLIQVLDRVTGLVIGTISTTANVLNVQPTAAGQMLAQESPKAAAQVQAELAAAQVLYPAYQAVAATVAAPPMPPAPTGPQGGQQQNNAPPGGSLNQPQQTGPAVNFSANVNADTSAVTATKVTVDPTPSAPTTPTAQTPPNPTITTPTPTPQPQSLPPAITAITPPPLQELGADQPGTLVSVATLTVTGQIATDALTSAGWAVPAGAPSTFFQKDFLYGMVSLDIRNSTLTYSLNVANPSVAALQPNQTLQDTVTVPVQGGASTTVTFTIDGVVHPTGVNTTASVNENVATNPTQVILHPQATDSISTHLTYQAQDLQGSAANGTTHGTLVQNPDGSFTYTPNAGFYGTDTIHFIAKDGQFLASDDFTITVTTNPVIAAVVGDDSVVTGNLLANDANPNDAIVNVQLGATAGNTFTVDGLYGELVVDANGHYTYTLGLTSVEKANLVALGDGHSAQDVFTYTISDGTVSSNANLVVDVTNHVPTISIAAIAGDNILNASEASAGFTITGSETGADGRPVTVAVVDGNDHVVASYTTTASEGSWSVNLTEQQATALADSSYTVTADVRDQFGNLATEATQTLAVHETLPTISIAAIAGDNVVNESEASAGFAITGSETGADGRPVSVAIVDGNGHVVASYTTTASEGSWAVGVTSQQATALADGSYRVTADVTDQFGNASALATRTFTVNDPPVILPGQTTASGSIIVPAGAAGSPLTALAVSYLTDGHDLVNGLGGSAGFGENVLAVGDDNSSSAINITSVFGSQGLNFFGHDYTSIYINNNGNITFAGPSSTFTPSQITAGANNPIIAAFWADVDTRGGAGTSTGGNATGSNRVYYDLDATNGVLTVTWDDVGYYNSHKDKLDAFQLQLVSLGNGNFDIVYRYQNINWTTGDASGGSGGLGGQVARAGYSAGDGVHYFELPSSGNQAEMLSLPNTQGDTSIAGLNVFQVDNGIVLPTTLTTSGDIVFTDPDNDDTHSITNIAYTGPGASLGTLSVVKDSDTSPSSDSGRFTWTYSATPASLAALAPGEVRIETFNVTISDDEGASVVQTVTMTLTGVDQVAPTIAVGVLPGNGSAAFAVSQGQAVVLTTVNLRAVDPDDAAGQLIFTAFSANQLRGHLAFDNDPATQITNFTEAQLEAGQVIFVHDGSSGSSASFSVSVKDANGLTSPTPTVVANVIQVEPNLWGDMKVPDVVPGRHIFTPNVQFNSIGGFLAIGYAAALNYDPVNDPQGPYARSHFAALTDPFLLPDQPTSLLLESNTVTLPARFFTITPNLNGTAPEALIASVSQTNTTNGSGTDVIHRTLVTENSDGTLHMSGLGQVGSVLTTGATIFNLNESYRTSDNTPSGTLQSYDVAWDQYNSTAHTYQVYFQTFAADNSAAAATPVLTSINLSSLANANALPAWQFRSGGGAYVFAAAQSETESELSSLNISATNPHDAIHFQGYNTDGTTNSVSFAIEPDLHTYSISNGGATNQIVQQVIPSLGPSPGQTLQQLQFVQVSSNNGSTYAIAWNEIVTDSAGTHDQVEFAAFKPGGTGIISRAQFQFAGGDVQNVHLAEFTDPANSSKDDVVLAYGDNAGTHIVEYQFATSGGTTTVTQIASIFDSSTQAYASMTSLGDGRVELTYDNQGAPDQTSQLDFKIFDLRTGPVTFDGQHNQTHHDNYIAGTSFNGDSVIGENGNINNTYYFVGGPTAPHDSFQGGQGSGWNTAIFSDSRASYSTHANADNTDITNVGDPAHGGTLTIDGAVQALAFAPTMDPTPGNNGGVVHASGDELLILGNVNNSSRVTAFAVDGAATLEFAGAVSDVSVTFDSPGGTLKIDQPSNFDTPVHGFGANFVDFVGVSSFDTVSVGAFSGGVTSVALINNFSGTDASINLAGDYTGTSFFVAYDGHGNALLGTDHAPQASYVNVAIDTSLVHAGTGTTIPGDLLAHFGTDPDPGDQLSLVSVDGSQTKGQVYEARSGDVVYTPPGSFVAPTGLVQAAGDQFSFTLEDSAGLTSTGHVALTAQGGTQIVGTTGHDLIMGASGDTLTGLGGDDVFVFQLNSGNQTISDFHQGADRVDLSAFYLNQTQSQAAQAMQALIDATTAGSHTLALDATHSITFQGVDVHQLNASNDFILTHAHTVGA